VSRIPTETYKGFNIFVRKVPGKLSAYAIVYGGNDHFSVGRYQALSRDEALEAAKAEIDTRDASQPGRTE
jgi:hypothetical protein